MKLTALRGISNETTPFFRNAIFKGLLIGLGFALFEVCVKVLFQREGMERIVLLGAMSGALLHIATGSILGTAWFVRAKTRGPLLFFILFLFAIILHLFYNALLSPFLFGNLS
jgi:RsiW-degrading membrane proteinase PrsW (M82 family)